MELWNTTDLQGSSDVFLLFPVLLVDILVWPRPKLVSSQMDWSVSRWCSGVGGQAFLTFRINSRSQWVPKHQMLCRFKLETPSGCKGLATTQARQQGLMCRLLVFHHLYTSGQNTMSSLGQRVKSAATSSQVRERVNMLTTKLLHPC